MKYVQIYMYTLLHILIYYTDITRCYYYKIDPRQRCSRVELLGNRRRRQLYTYILCEQSVYPMFISHSFATHCVRTRTRMDTARAWSRLEYY